MIEFGGEIGKEKIQIDLLKDIRNETLMAGLSTYDQTTGYL